MKTILAAIILIVVTFPVKGQIIDRPNKEYPRQALENFGWLNSDNQFLVYIDITDDTEKFITKDSLYRYFQLKMRNFVTNLILTEKSDGFSHNYMYLEVELYKYNDKTSIYTGLISLRADSSVSWIGDSRTYQLTTSIAGSKSQILRFIKEELDLFAEILAQDIYLVEDILANHEKPTNEVN